MDRLQEIKEALPLLKLYGSLKEDIDWLIEQAEKAITFKNALENISDILEGQNVTELVERIAYELSYSGIYDKLRGKE